MDSLNALSEMLYKVIGGFSDERIDTLIKECTVADRQNCSWHSYYLSTTAKNYAVHIKRLRKMTAGDVVNKLLREDNKCSS